VDGKIGHRQRMLLDGAARTERRAREFAAWLAPEDAELLAWVAGLQREMAGFYAADPTLEQDATGLTMCWRDREIDLAGELCRQLPAVLSQARHGERHGATPAELDAMVTRIGLVMAEARKAPRPNWREPEVSRELSLLRLRGACPSVIEAATNAEARLSPALQLPHPAAEVLELLALAAALRERAEALLAGEQQLEPEPTAP
jgi:hypothetical protein